MSENINHQLILLLIFWWEI